MSKKAVLLMGTPEQLIIYGEILNRSEEGTCEICGKENEELRPYGPKGEKICYKCGHATPEQIKLSNKKIAERIDEIEKTVNEKID